MAVDVQGFTSLVFERLKSSAATDAAGVAIGPLVRAALGAGADSVIHAEELKKYAPPQNAPAPPRPLIAFRAGVVAGLSYDMRPLTFTWWVYDAPGGGYWRINGLLPLIERAYPRDSIAFAHVAVTNIGQETTDPVLGWNVRPLQLTLTTRG